MAETALKTMEKTIRVIVFQEDGFWVGYAWSMT